jgi:hypothetical protein
MWLKALKGSLGTKALDFGYVVPKIEVKTAFRQWYRPFWATRVRRNSFVLQLHGGTGWRIPSLFPLPHTWCSAPLIEVAKLLDRTQSAETIEFWVRFRGRAVHFWAVFSRRDVVDTKGGCRSRSVFDFVSRHCMW